MDRREWAITVLGLLGTFLLPWPDAAERGSMQRMALEARCRAHICPAAHAGDAEHRDERVGRGAAQPAR